MSVPAPPSLWVEESVVGDGCGRGNGTPRGVSTVSLTGSEIGSPSNLFRNGIENTGGEWLEQPTRRGRCHSGVLLRGAQRGGLRLVLPLEFIVGPQGAGTSAGCGSLTLGGVEGSISGNVQAFRIPSRSCTPYLVTVPAAREAQGQYLPDLGGLAQRPVWLACRSARRPSMLPSSVSH